MVTLRENKVVCSFQPIATSFYHQYLVIYRLGGTYMDLPRTTTAAARTTAAETARATTNNQKTNNKKRWQGQRQKQQRQQTSELSRIATACWMWNNHLTDQPTKQPTYRLPTSQATTVSNLPTNLPTNLPPNQPPNLRTYQPTNTPNSSAPPLPGILRCDVQGGSTMFHGHLVQHLWRTCPRTAGAIGSWPKISHG